MNIKSQDDGLADNEARKRLINEVHGKSFLSTWIIVIEHDESTIKSPILVVNLNTKRLELMRSYFLAIFCNWIERYNPVLGCTDQNELLGCTSKEVYCCRLRISTFSIRNFNEKIQM